MWLKIRLCKGFSSQCRGRENTARKSNKKSPGRQPVHYHPGESIISGKSAYLTILAIDATIVAKEAKEVA